MKTILKERKNMEKAENKSCLFVQNQETFFRLFFFTSSVFRDRYTAIYIQQSFIYKKMDFCTTTEAAKLQEKVDVGKNCDVAITFSLSNGPSTHYCISFDNILFYIL